MQQRFRIVLVICLAVAVAGLLATPLFAGDREQVPVHIKAIGHPIWKPIDFHVFSCLD